MSGGSWERVLTPLPLASFINLRDNLEGSLWILFLNSGCASSYHGSSLSDVENQDIVLSRILCSDIGTDLSVVATEEIPVLY